MWETYQKFSASFTKWRIGTIARVARQHIVAYDIVFVVWDPVIFNIKGADSVTLSKAVQDPQYTCWNKATYEVSRGPDRLRKKNTWVQLPRG